MEDNEKKLQGEELEEVSGGEMKNCCTNILCAHCGKHFDFLCAEHKNVSKGCSKFTVYKCPNCGKWVNEYGSVYNG